MVTNLPHKAEAIAKRLVDHGRHVFVYSHIWTGQTVYSLDRVLNVRPSTSRRQNLFKPRPLIADNPCRTMPR